MNRRLGNIGTFGSCTRECEKGEPAQLSDGRFVQANHCPLGACVIVSEEPIADTAVDSFPTPTPLGILYREAELEELGSGDAEKGLEHVLAAFADDPQAVEFGAVKPANTDPDTAPIVAIDPSEIPATSAANQSIIDAMPTPTTEGGAFALFLALELDAMERGLSTPEQSTETLADLFGNRDIGQD